MLAKPFSAEKPVDTTLARGWHAERQMAFYLARAFEPVQDVVVFNGLRFSVPGSAPGDCAQIDHLVLHRHGAVIVESKATGDGTGEFHVDAMGQWTRGRGFNMTSPVAQAKVQADALRRLLSAAEPPLLDKVAGLVQQRFTNFPILPAVAISDKARLVGPGAQGLSDVMKAERIVDVVRDEIALHRKHTGVLGAMREGGADRGTYNLSDAALDRISQYLLRHDLTTPRAPSAPKPMASSESRKLEALACRHCRSIRVTPVYRNDYCLLCDECNKYTPLDRLCVRCGKAATVRKRGAEFFRVCDKAGGCAAEVVFWKGD
jgi:hypothetical protein